MNNNGWIRLHRQILDCEDWLSEPFTRAQAWVDLLLIANHKKGYVRKRGILIEIERGEVGLSESGLASRWRWSKGKVIRFLSDLKNRQQIGRKTAPKNKQLNSLIYITNYDKYQFDGTEDSTEDGTENGPKTGPGTKKNKKNKNLNPIRSDFDAFWKTYPKKIGKQAAQRAFETHQKSIPPAEQLLSILERQKQTDQWKRGFIPNPATWINQGRWDDDIEAMNGGKEHGSNRIYAGQKQNIPTPRQREIDAETERLSAEYYRLKGDPSHGNP